MLGQIVTPFWLCTDILELGNLKERVSANGTLITLEVEEKLLKINESRTAEKEKREEKAHYKS